MFDATRLQQRNWAVHILVTRGLDIDGFSLSTICRNMETLQLKYVLLEQIEKRTRECNFVFKSLSDNKNFDGGYVYIFVSEGGTYA